jgi:hypothetical protein
MAAASLLSVNAEPTDEDPDEIVKVATPPTSAQHPRSPARDVRAALDSAILMGDADIVAGRCHAVVGRQRVTAAGQVAPSFIKPGRTLSS